MFHFATFFNEDGVKLNLIHQDEGKDFFFILCLEKYCDCSAANKRRLRLKTNNVKCSIYNEQIKKIKMIKKERKFDIEDSLIVFAVMIAKIVGIPFKHKSC